MAGERGGSARLHASCPFIRHGVPWLWRAHGASRAGAAAARAQARRSASSARTHASSIAYLERLSEDGSHNELYLDGVAGLVKLSYTRCWPRFLTLWARRDTHTAKSRGTHSRNRPFYIPSDLLRPSTPSAAPYRRRPPPPPRVCTAENTSPGPGPPGSAPCPTIPLQLSAAAPAAATAPASCVAASLSPTRPRGATPRATPSSAPSRRCGRCRPCAESMLVITWPASHGGRAMRQRMAAARQ